MGTNGSGKTSLAYALAGHPFIHSQWSVQNFNLNRQNLLDQTPNQRAQSGLFLAFQYPVAIPGVPVQNFLKKRLRKHPLCQLHFE
jgi:Fe-S cluster assembly ATP-binding protein